MKVLKSIGKVLRKAWELEGHCYFIVKWAVIYWFDKHILQLEYTKQQH